jgi:hypothetical protein
MNRQERLNKIKTIKSAAIYYSDTSEYKRPNDPISISEEDFFGGDFPEPIYPPQIMEDFDIPKATKKIKKSYPKEKPDPQGKVIDDPNLDAPDPHRIALHDDPSFTAPPIPEILMRLKKTKANRIERLNKFAKLFL